MTKLEKLDDTSILSSIPFFVAAYLNLQHTTK